MRVLLLLVAGALLPWGVAAAYGEDDAPEDPAALVGAWLAAKPVARERLAARVRAAGAKAAPALRKAAVGAEPGRRRRIERLLGRIRADHHRAHTPRGMIYVPAGALEVPRAEAPWGPSGARRQVPAFYIDRTEVTVRAWRRWLAALEAEEEGQAKRLGLYRPPEQVPGLLPVAWVRHVDAERYARAHDARLPTADEFERALRGSGLSTWPWGGRGSKDRANLLGHGPGAVEPVGSHPAGASAFGVLDLVGNVAEWSATFVRQGSRGRYPLLLGGSYIDRPEAALTWRGLGRGRARTGSRERQPWIGFRLARTPPDLP